MLKKISCDKFRENGIYGKSIVFHNGLNTILGPENAANSIGKSTTLMIIDFCFGGDDYIFRNREVFDIIGHHTIKFEYQFDKSYYFSRSTNDYTNVNICDSEYKIIATISNNDFMKRIATLYGITNQTLRDVVSPFFRIYHRETLNEEKPINASFREASNVPIVRLLKLYNVYTSLEKLKDDYESAKEKLDSLKKASNHKFIKRINQDGYKKNIKRIEQLKLELKELMLKNDQGTTSLEDVNKEKRIKINSELSILEMEKSKYDIRNLRFSKTRKSIASQSDFEELKKFFKDVDLEEITKIEQFHTKISGIMKAEYDKLVREATEKIKQIDEQIKILEDEYKTMENIPNVQDAVLNRHHEISKEIDEMNNQNDLYNEENSIKSIKEKAEEALNKEVDEVLSTLEIELNQKMLILNSSIYSSSKTCPSIKFKKLDNYWLKTPKDTGTGTQQRGLAIFDLAALENTKLPAFIHDSVMLKHIEDITLSKLFSYYSKESKQIFIAFDRANTYGSETSKLLHDTSVISLFPNGGEIFGISFNKKIEELKKEA